MIFNLHFFTLLLVQTRPPKIKKQKNSSELDASAECKNSLEKKSSDLSVGFAISQDTRFLMYRFLMSSSL